MYPVKTEKSTLSLSLIISIKCHTFILPNQNLSQPDHLIKAMQNILSCQVSFYNICPGTEYNTHVLLLVLFNLRMATSFFQLDRKGKHACQILKITNLYFPAICFISKYNGNRVPKLCLKQPVSCP